MPKLINIRPRLTTFDTSIAKTPPKTADPFYLTKEWRALMASIVVERGRKCEDRLCKQRHRRDVRVYGDHIIELKDGGAALDKRNVMLRCGSCHSRKTIEERAKRMARKATGASLGD